MDGETIRFDVKYFESLPIEIQIKIFESMTYKTLHSLSRSCKHFSKLRTEEYDYLWKQMFVKTCEPVNVYKDIVQFNEINNCNFGNWYEAYTDIMRLTMDETTLLGETMYGNLESINYMLNRMEGYINTVMVTASYYGYMDILKYLISRGAKVSYKNYMSMQSAVLGNSINAVMYLDSISDNVVGRSFVLLETDINTSMDIIKYLVTKGVDHDVLNTYLIEVVKREQYPLQLQTVTYLVESGADIHVDSDETLMHAVDNNNIKLVQYIIDKGVNVNTENGAALTIACENRHEDMVQYLLSRGCTVNEESMKTSVKLGDIDILKHLIQWGGDVHMNDDVLVKHAVVADKLEMLKYLVSIGCRVNKYVDELLEKTLKKGYWNMFRFLISNWANAHQINACMILATERGKLNAVKFLHSKGGNIRECNDRCLMIAAEKGHLSIIKYLQSKGVDIKIQDNEALMMAAKGGHNNIIQYLLLNGANICARNRLIIKYAIQSGNTDTLDLLNYLFRI